MAHVPDGSGATVSQFLHTYTLSYIADQCMGYIYWIEHEEHTCFPINLRASLVSPEGKFRETTID